MITRQSFASEAPFVGRRWAYNREEERYEVRLFEGRLQVTPEKMFADIGTPNGIQLLWQHGIVERLRPVDGSSFRNGFRGQGARGLSVDERG